MQPELDSEIILANRAIREAVRYKKENPVFHIDKLDLPDQLGLKIWGQERDPEGSPAKNPAPLPDSAITDPSDEKRTRGNMPSDSTISIQPRWDQAPNTKPDTNAGEPKEGGDIHKRPDLATGMQGDPFDKNIPEGRGVQEGFAGYSDFDDCKSKNRSKDNPDAYCGSIKHQVEG